MTASRYQVTIEYDGTDFHGWQAQEGWRTVQGCLREAVAQLSPGGYEVIGASRTDRGVHALGQRASIELDRPRPPEQVLSALRALTPEDMSIRDCDFAPPDFHARFSAIEKRYLYRLFVSSSGPTFGRGWRWWVPGPVDVEAMNAAARVVVGEHDFAGFRNRSKDEPDNPVRTIRHAEWSGGGEDLFFQVIGNAFLYKMVRNLVGTFVEVGRGLRSVDSVREVLATGERQRGGVTAPPQGLFLMEIQYPGEPPCAPQAAPPTF